MFFSSFALIDFFNDKRSGNNNDELVKDLIDQNLNPNSISNSPQKSNNNDIISRNELIEKKNINQNIESKGNLNVDNIIKINADNNNQKQKKKCGC